MSASGDEPTGDTPLSGQMVNRTFTYQCQDATGVYKRFGPDGQETRTALDEAERVLKKLSRPVKAVLLYALAPAA